MTAERNLCCGEALCKRRLSVKLDRAALWPLRCPHCGVSLYPYDVLRSTPAKELEPQRAELQVETAAGRRAAVSAAELRQLAGAGSEPPLEEEADAAAVERLLGLVDLGGAPPAPQPSVGPSRWLSAGGLVVIVVVIVIVAVALALRLW